MFRQLTKIRNGRGTSLEFSIHCALRRRRHTYAEDQYLQISSVPTLHFQPSLPRLPIPELSKTCDRYLRSVKPILSSSEYETTEKITKEFLLNDGAALHKHLVASDKANSHTSYISKPWTDVYFSDRVPLPLNYNPIIVYINSSKPSFNSQLIRTTNLLISSLRFLKSLRANILEPEVFHLNPKKSDTPFFRTFTGLLPSSISWYGAYMFNAYPLDMSQYKHLFNTSRIPEQNKDRLFHDASKRHILVMHKGHFYVFDVLDQAGNIIEPSKILGCLKYILELKTPAEYPIGVLTTLDRNHWAKLRGSLESLGNSEALGLVDSSLFNISLDDENCQDDIEKTTQLFLHADGTNRWFDKSFSLIVSADGVAGLNFEHSWGDGVAVLRYFQDTYKDSDTKPVIHPDSKPDNSIISSVKKLDFKLDDNVKSSIIKAKEDYKKTCNSLQIDFSQFESFGRNLCKKKGVSPDLVMQLAFQVAYDKLAGKQVGTYESCSTAAFKHGRTETVRPCTIETTKFCKAINGPNKPSVDELKKAIMECSTKHSNLVKEAAMGQGFDRHLFALRTIAQNENNRIPAIFQDIAYKRINHNILSTSTLTSPTVMLGGFGPVVKDGFGIGYSILDDKLGAIVTSYRGQSDGAGFQKSLSMALQDIYSILK
nr:PREDICTED: carnitine O-palmitoyltransferase 2, mitochondrial [Bemisia tabaci]XP_018904355.1 PREDICTED: carnitine O-palmitoyltransferase 2, mitochondrial [Bemisia tabaci]XP_018904356.1 PREDICTED: carnitine O-palmitoyltransferase 2, mitochondrial [Bemisia tabaci]